MRGARHSPPVAFGSVLNYASLVAAVATLLAVAYGPILPLPLGWWKWPAA